MAFGAGDGQPGALGLAAIPAPDGGRARLCRLRRGLHRGGHPVALAVRQGDTVHQRLGWCGGLLPRDGHHHVRAESPWLMATLADGGRRLADLFSTGLRMTR